MQASLLATESSLATVCTNGEGLRDSNTNRQAGSIFGETQ
jgi:hypothetical protein